MYINYLIQISIQLHDGYKIQVKFDIVSFSFETNSSLRRVLIELSYNLFELSSLSHLRDNIEI